MCAARSSQTRTRAAGEEPEFQPRNTTQRGEFVQALALWTSLFPVPTTMYPISPGLKASSLLASFQDDAYYQSRKAILDHTQL